MNAGVPLIMKELKLLGMRGMVCIILRFYFVLLPSLICYVLVTVVFYAVLHQGRKENEIILHSVICVIAAMMAQVLPFVCVVIIDLHRTISQLDYCCYC